MPSIEKLRELVSTWLPPNEHLDVLVNNAALGSKTVVNYVRLKASAATSEHDIFGTLPAPHLNDLALLRVNSLGPIWLSSHLTPYLSPRARIIFLGSVGGNSGVFPEYRHSDLASKAALGYAAKHLAARWLGDTPGGAWGPEGYNAGSEGRERGWTVITVAPGATQTSMFRASNPTQAVQATSGETFPPKGRLIDPGEIAELVYFCGVEPAAEVLHGGVVDASLGLGSRWGVQTERPRP
jgi:NAD(P)-dependent dehydrogenase (short-subunit alcohol dehydrogenase family)